MSTNISPMVVDGGDTRSSSATSDERPRRRWPGAFSTPASGTRGADYAVLEAIFLIGLAGVAALARSRANDGAPAVPRAELPIIAMATFTLADVLAKEKISTWLRAPFVEESADHKPVVPEGRGMRYAIGELLTCTRCVGTWSALGLTGLRIAAPVTGQATATVLALAGANDFLQGTFRLLVERTNRATLETAAARSIS